MTCRAFTVLQNHTEYVTTPPGEVRESLRTSSPVTQITPGFGVGVGDLDGDFDGLGDFDGDGLVLDGDGLGLLEGVVLFDGLGLCVGVLVGLGDLVGVGVGVALGDFDAVGVDDGWLEVAVGFGLTELLVGRGLIFGAVSGIMLARTACADARPHTASSKGVLGAAKTGATAGPATRNSPAPAATAACPTRTILTGTAALR